MSLILIFYLASDSSPRYKWPHSSLTLLLELFTIIPNHQSFQHVISSNNCNVLGITNSLQFHITVCTILLVSFSWTVICFTILPTFYISLVLVVSQTCMYYFHFFSILCTTFYLPILFYFILFHFSCVATGPDRYCCYIFWMNLHDHDLNTIVFFTLLLLYPLLTLLISLCSRLKFIFITTCILAFLFFPFIIIVPIYTRLLSYPFLQYP